MSDLDQNIVGIVGVVIADSQNEYDIHNISEQEVQTTIYEDLKEGSLVVDPVVLLPDVSVISNFTDKKSICDGTICIVKEEDNKIFFSALSAIQDKASENNLSIYSQDFFNFIYKIYVSVNEFLKQHDPFPNFLVIQGVEAQRGAARASASTSATQTRGSSSRGYRMPSFDPPTAAANYNMPHAANSNLRAPVFPGDAPPIRFPTQGTTPSTFPTSTSPTTYYPTSGMGTARQHQEPASIFPQTNYPSYQSSGFSFPSSTPFSSSNFPSSSNSYPSSSSFHSYSITVTLPTPSFSSDSLLRPITARDTPLSIPSYSPVESSSPLSFDIPDINLFPPRQEEEMPGFFHGVTLGPPETPLIQDFPEAASRWRDWKAARYKLYMPSIQRALKHTYRMLFINCIPIDEEYVRMVLKKVDLATIASALESGFVLETIFMRSPLYEQFKARAAERKKAVKLENVAGSGGGNWNNGTGTDSGSKWFQWFNTVDDDFDSRTCLYKESPAHTGSNKHKSRAPTDGQKNLPNSYRFSESGRVSVDLDNTEIIIYRRERPNVYHGYVVTPEVLRSRETGAYALLRELDMIKKNGKIK